MRSKADFLEPSGSSVTIVSYLRDGRPGFDTRQEQGYFPLRYSVHMGSMAHPSSYKMSTDSFIPGCEAVQLAPKVRTRGTIPPFDLTSSYYEV